MLAYIHSKHIGNMLKYQILRVFKQIQKYYRVLYIEHFFYTNHAFKKKNWIWNVLKTSSILKKICFEALTV